MEIGGYFELELTKGQEYYPNLIKLNSGRSCLEYILLAEKYSKIYLPYYICDVVLEPIARLGICFEFYSINKDFTIKDSISLNETEVLLYVNYFGMMDDYILSLSKSFSNLIVDNAQAFYSKPIENVITYYSPRKFFGVADGGYLSINKRLDRELAQGYSSPNANYLLKRIDEGSQAGYFGFRENEMQFSKSGLKTMSKLTSTILSSIEYKLIKQKREENFNFIHSRLGDKNKLTINTEKIEGSMAYPILIKSQGLRKFLIDNKVFVAKYWENVIKTCNKSSFEHYLAEQLILLPVDQRYGLSEMQYMVKIILNFL